MYTGPLPLFWLSLAFLAGVWLADRAGWPALAWQAPCAVALLLALAGRRWRPLAWLSRGLGRSGAAPALLLAAACLGGWRFTAHQAAVNALSLAPWVGRGPVAVQGVIAEPPAPGERTIRLLVRARQVAAVLDDGQPGPWQPAGGLLLAQTVSWQDWRAGDAVELRGTLEAPGQFGSPGYRANLQRRGVHTALNYVPCRSLDSHPSGPQRLASALRARALAAAQTLLPDPAGALLQGVVLGDDSRLSPAVRQAFQATGAAHLLAVSGFNITILAGLLLQLFSRWLGRWWSALAAAAGIAGYTLLVGGGASVVRAALMGGLVIAAQQIGRRSVGLNSLLLAGAGMVAWQPHWLWDLGFQLSFAATFGLVVYGEPFQRAGQRWLSRIVPAGARPWMVPILNDGLLLTAAALVPTLPLTLVAFEQFSPWTLLVNLLVLPVQPALMALGGLALLAASAWPPLGFPLAWLAYPLAMYTVRAVEVVAGLPGAVIPVGPLAPGWLALYFALLGWLTALRPRLPAVRPLYVAAGLAVCTGLVWQSALAMQPGALRLTVSQSAVLVRGPTGRAVLVLPGAPGMEAGDLVGRRLPVLGPGLDGVVLLHGSARAAAQLNQPAWQRYYPGWVVWAGAELPQAAAADALAGAAPAWRPAYDGMQIALGGETVLALHGAGDTVWAEFRHGALRACLPAGGAACPASALDLSELIPPGEPWVEITTNGQTYTLAGGR